MDKMALLPPLLSDSIAYKNTLYKCAHSLIQTVFFILVFQRNNLTPLFWVLSFSTPPEPIVSDLSASYKNSRFQYNNFVIQLVLLCCSYQ